MPDTTPPTIYIAAALILDSAGRTLLVRKRGTEAFMQAGGKIEPHETPVEALLRELEEELGVRMDERPWEYLGVFDAPAANETGRRVRAESFLVRADVSVSPAREIEEIAWVRPDDARLPLAPLTRDHLLPIACDRLRRSP